MALEKMPHTITMVGAVERCPGSRARREAKIGASYGFTSLIKKSHRLRMAEVVDGFGLAGRKSAIIANLIGGESMGEGGTENVGSKKLLASIATGKMSATDVLTELTEEQLTEMLFPTFVRIGDDTIVGKGEGILPGDVSGQLVIDRELGERLLEEAEARRTEIDLVYSPPSGSLEDFRVLRACVRSSTWLQSVDHKVDYRDQDEIDSSLAARSS